MFFSFFRRKFSLLVLFTFFLGIAAMAQEELKFNRLSAEVSTGIHIPITPLDGIVVKDYVGVINQFQVSGRYMFNGKFGMKGFVAYNHFRDHRDKDLKNPFTRIGLEGVMSIGDLIFPNYRTRDQLNLLVHGGLGYAQGKAASIKSNSVNRMGNIILGVTGQKRISDRLAFVVDLSYIANLNQIYSYNGDLLPPDAQSTSDVGGFLNISVGLEFYVGKQEIHSDWY